MSENTGIDFLDFCPYIEKCGGKWQDWFDDEPCPGAIPCNEHGAPCWLYENVYLKIKKFKESMILENKIERFAGLFFSRAFWRVTSENEKLTRVIESQPFGRETMNNHAEIRELNEEITFYKKLLANTFDEDCIEAIKEGKEYLVNIRNHCPSCGLIIFPDNEGCQACGWGYCEDET